MITIIAAIDLERCIGKNGKIPWRIPSDLKRFKTLTIGHAIIMGRKTYESLPDNYRPLPDRFNIVLSKGLPRRNSENLAIVRSMNEALALSSKEVDIIGGAEIYRQGLAFAERIYLTEVQTITENGDTFFPSVDKWNLVECTAITQSEGDQFPSRLLVYRR